MDDDALLPVLLRAWQAPFTTRSDFSRAHTDHIAMAACLGLITVRNTNGDWGRTWRISARGLHILENHNAPAY